ncbi:AarF/ABC1/UbiB kinase family protein [Euryarchaeota archaeon]|mgnify:FL=1|nr:AarF/ABC1/UbiB kinase family protein [Euryarchaeota archaeon]MDA9166725.1 AarF/ABC1/UbiB kinase family protein [Candidatus Poseidoniaceae archaeon]MDA8689823.1 AarF/ABC1/UbiB kinase family protein [Euryarchaeota archaeon]MDA8843252.1 AarF/ABC1/UbiB kinase family protein [Euryarchaeota archaeon]MDA9829330.1 AarF/ABC1/UbiB kinase family protein [Candidatus Poseidoniaceae archaeon]
MRAFTFFRFMRQILRKKPADLDWIQRQGLIAVKLAQIFALRPDLLGVEKCRQLQQLYQHAASIESENLHETIAKKAPKGFTDAFDFIDDQPLAAASVGQVHRGRLKTGEEVVIKFIKQTNAVEFKKEVTRMRRWLRIFLIFAPKLRKVGNPMALINHVADYTLRELDLRNEIKGADELKGIQTSLSNDFEMSLLRFPVYYSELSNQDILVSEYIEGMSLEEGIEEKSLSWDFLLQFFRIHGAFLFGIGTFHGDLHPGNCIVDKDGKFVFIDNGAICHAPKHVAHSLFTFFDHLSRQERQEAFTALLAMTEVTPNEKKLKKYYSTMGEIYHDFENKPVGEQSLTRIMMKTVRAAVEHAGANFGEEAFPIIRALMYLDGLVIRTHPDALLIQSMGPFLEEFKEKLNI